MRGTYIYASVVGPKEEHAAAEEDDGKPFLVVSAVEYQQLNQILQHADTARWY